MGTMQYIGARYVPLFYEGSDGNNWDSGITYEPLTIVTYLGTFWTSKKRVPSTVGAPNLNSEYWIATGDFNSQYNELLNEVSSIETVLNEKLLFVTPEMFGAVGDGVTDDKLAIKECLDYAELNDLPVFFSSKIYAVSGQISKTRSALADGWYFGIFMNNGTTIKYTGSSYSDAVLYFQNYGDKLRITGGTIDGNNVAKNCLVLDTCNGVFVNSMNLINAGHTGDNYGDILLNNCKHCWISDCKLINRVTHSNGIVNIDTPDTRIYNCEISYVDIGVKSNYGIIILTNCHIWAGGVLNPSTDTIGIKDDSAQPRIFIDNVYIDGFNTGIDCGDRLSFFYGAGNLFYYPETMSIAAGDHVKGIKTGTASYFALKGTRFQAASGIVVDELVYGSQVLYYAGIRDVNNLFSKTGNVGTVTRLNSRIYDHMLTTSFHIAIADTETDDTNVIPIFTTGEQPDVLPAFGRFDFVAWNYTQNKPVACRVNLYTADNIIKIHCNTDVAVGDVIVGSFNIKVR